MKLFMLLKKKLDKYNDASDKSKITSYLDFDQIYNFVNKAKNI